jgi:hypothetical protein
MPWQLLAGVLPAFWPMRALWAVAAGDSGVPFLAVGVASGLVTALLSALLFEYRLVRRA